MTVRGDPETPVGAHAECKNKSAASEFAADPHDCIMVRVLGPAGYKMVARLRWAGFVSTASSASGWQSAHVA